MHPRRRGDEEVPLTLMLLPAAAAGREDLRLDVVGARLEKFEALRDGKFEMKDMVPCSGLEPLQSASMVASWPRRCAALRAVCLLNHLNTRSPRPRALGKIGKCSISQSAKVSLVGEHEKSKIDVIEIGFRFFSNNSCGKYGSTKEDLIKKLKFNHNQILAVMINYC